MVNNCVAFGCPKVYVRDPNVHFHTFPFKRPEILKLWVEAIKRGDWRPAPTSRLCSIHFTPDDYLERPGRKKKILKSDAVPSIFVCSKYPPERAKDRTVAAQSVKPHRLSPERVKNSFSSRKSKAKKIRKNQTDEECENSCDDPVPLSDDSDSESDM